MLESFRGVFENDSKTPRLEFEWFPTDRSGRSFASWQSVAWSLPWWILDFETGGDQIGTRGYHGTATELAGPSASLTPSHLDINPPLSSCGLLGGHTFAQNSSWRHRQFPSNTHPATYAHPANLLLLPVRDLPEFA